MKTSKRIKNENKDQEHFLSYEKLIDLKDTDLIYINTTFLYSILSYHKLTDKLTKEIALIINNTFRYNKTNPDTIINPMYSIISVRSAKILLENMPKNLIRESAFIKDFNGKREKLTSNKAYELLTSYVIKDKSDYSKPENRWILHSLYVGTAARRIATKLGLDGDYAATLGYIHDIGRKISHENHLIEGYQSLIKKGFSDEARICLTHSFIDNNIKLTAGSGPRDEIYEFLNIFLKQHKVNIYDNIIQLCDLFCLETGFTTIEKRMLDLAKRKGVFESSKTHFEATIELKEKIEESLGCNLYDLFIEIQDDLNNILEDRQELNRLFEEKRKKLVK